MGMMSDINDDARTASWKNGFLWGAGAASIGWLIGILTGAFGF
jgi:hypothetical protein